MISQVLAASPWFKTRLSSMMIGFGIHYRLSLVVLVFFSTIHLKLDLSLIQIFYTFIYF
jgi:hypothetical protein